MPPPASPWIYQPRPLTDASLRLFCFPFAGGGPVLFRNWPSQLPDRIDICGIRLPGRESRWREPPFTRLPALIAALVPGLRSWFDRPFAFFGYSLGALIAYELTRALQAAGGPMPKHLFVSAAQAPFHPLPREPLHDLPEDKFRDALQSLGGTPREILDNRELMDLLTPMLRGDFALLETHTHQPGPPLACPITAIGAWDDARVAPDRIDGWQTLTRDTFQKKMIAGDHFFLVSRERELLKLVNDDLGPLVARLRPSLNWPPTGALTIPEPHQARVLAFALEQSPARFALLEQTLSADERERARRLVFDRDRRSFMAARGFVRMALGQCLNRDPASLTFGYSAKGKPFLRDAPDGLHFNLAHSHGVVLLAITHGHEVGIDVEFIRDDVEAESLAGSFFSAAELQALRLLAPDQFRAAFFRVWARKEAYLKAIGKGLSLSLKDFDVSIDADSATLLATRHDEAEAGRWKLLPLSPAEGYAAALAVGATVSECRCEVFALT